MKYYYLFVLFIFSCTAYSEQLKKNEVYRTKVNLMVSKVKLIGDLAKKNSSLDLKNLKYKVGADSKFEILDNSNKHYYLIRFSKIYHFKTAKKNPLTDCKKKNPLKCQNYNEEYSDVIEGERYYLYKGDKLEGQFLVEDVIQKSFAGAVSGPLIVPFKYRLNDKSFSGEAMVGYYAGIGMDIWEVAVTPFVSAGLSQINIARNVSGEVETDSQTGFTFAVGFLIQNWDNVNIGFVYGQDRIGDQNWEHEGEEWVSLSVGWKMK